MQNFKCGFDVHGVMDTQPELFSALTQSLYKDGWEIHLITGPKWDDALAIWLADHGIAWTHFFSIVAHHEARGTPIRYTEEGPWLDPYLWDKAKAEYCEREGISLHFDDSDVYGYFFKTPYSRFFSKDTLRQDKMHL